MNNLLDDIIIDDNTLSSDNDNIKEIIIDNKYEYSDKNIIIDIVDQINDKIYNCLILLNIIIIHLLIFIISCIYITNNINTISYISIITSIIVVYLTSCYYLYNKIIKFINFNKTLSKIRSIIDYYYIKKSNKKYKV
jgi:hypothetical protein